MKFQTLFTGVAAIAAALHLQAVTFNDGGTHTINDATYQTIPAAEVPGQEMNSSSAR